MKAFRLPEPVAEKLAEAYYRKRTNADRIRSMSDEELAGWLSIYCCGDKTYDANCETLGSCEACWLGWLKQEAT